MASGPTTEIDVTSLNGVEYNFTFVGTLATEDIVEKLDDIFAETYHDLGEAWSTMSVHHSHS